MVRTDVPDRRHFGSRPGDEAFVKLAELGRQDSPLDEFKPTLAREIDNRRSGDAGQEAVGYWRVNQPRS